MKQETINEIIKFRDDRNWKQFHNPKDLAISISLEAAELLEVFQWSAGDVNCEEKKYKIREELFRRGVPREHWDEALSQAEVPDEAIDTFIARKLRGIEHPDRKDLKRVSDALARRGFSWNDISTALRRYGAEFEE